MTNKKRGANGGGTIRQRADGTWEARITLGTNPGTGKPMRKSFYGKTQKEVRQRMTEALNALDKGTYQATSKTTVSAWMNEWLETFCANKLKPYTVSSYRGIIDNHINKHIGAMQLQAVKGSHIQRMYNKMIADGAAPKTVKNIGAVAHKAFSMAVKQDIIPANPCDAAELPAMQQHEIKPLTDADIPVFLKAIEAEAMCNAFALCLFAGLREGECLGLSWEQVDFDKQAITICQQLQKEKTTGGQYQIVPFTKSNKPRTIKPPSIAFDYLKREQKRQAMNRLQAGQMWANPHNLVFTNDVGGNLAISTFYKTFKRIAASIGRPDARPHDLRHTAATVAIASGADVKSVQSMLGHATASFTLNVYAHTSEKMMEDTAARMQNYYSGIANRGN